MYNFIHNLVVAIIEGVFGFDIEHRSFILFWFQEPERQLSRSRFGFCAPKISSKPGEI